MTGELIVVCLIFMVGLVADSVSTVRGLRRGVEEELLGIRFALRFFQPLTAVVVVKALAVAVVVAVFAWYGVDGYSLVGVATLGFLQLGAAILNARK